MLSLALAPSSALRCLSDTLCGASTVLSLTHTVPLSLALSLALSQCVTFSLSLLHTRDHSLTLILSLTLLAHQSIYYRSTNHQSIQPCTVTQTSPLAFVELIITPFFSSTSVHGQRGAAVHGVRLGGCRIRLRRSVHLLAQCSLSVHLSAFTVASFQVHCLLQSVHLSPSTFAVSPSNFWSLGLGVYG